MTTLAPENTQVAAKPKAELRPIDTVRAQLEKMKPEFAMALPKHITPDRLMRVALTACQQTPKLLDCDRKSLFSAIMRSAQLGLEPDGILGQAYLIPFGNQVQFIAGYKGLIDLARRSGEVSNIIAKEVYENDEFSVDFSQDVPFVHKPLLSGERGEVTHFWAMARFKDGGFHWDYMTRAEVEKIRDNGQGKNNAVWKNHFIEMAKKTAIRRIAKYLPMSVQKAAIVDDLMDAGKKFHHNEFGEIIIDGDVSIVDDAAPAKGNEALKAKLAKADAAGADRDTGEIKKDDYVLSGKLPDGSTYTIEEFGDTIPAKDEAGAVAAYAEFNINEFNIKTQAGIKDAVKALVAVLAQHNESERGGVFVASGGNDLVSAASRHGMGPLKQQFVALGVKFHEEA